MSGIAVLLPGTGYSVQRPLLHWAGALLRERGWTVREVAWEVPEEAFEEPAAFVEPHLAEAFDGTDGPRLVVAKSFGCFGLAWAVREQVPGVWLTPVLADEGLRAALAAAPARHLVVGGAEDPLWAGGPGAIEAEVVEVPGADHGLEVPGDWAASLEAQRAVLERIASFTGGL